MTTALSALRTICETSLDVAECRTVINALDSPTKTGTMQSWFQARPGYKVTTVQVSYDGSVWAPKGRVVNASRASYVMLSGSIRDYAGMRVVHNAGDCLIVENGSTAIAYLPEID